MVGEGRASYRAYRKLTTSTRHCRGIPAIANHVDSSAHRTMVMTAPLARVAHGRVAPLGARQHGHCLRLQPLRAAQTLTAVETSKKEKKEGASCSCWALPSEPRTLGAPPFHSQGQGGEGAV